MRVSLHLRVIHRVPHQYNLKKPLNTPSTQTLLQPHRLSSITVQAMPKPSQPKPNPNSKPAQRPQPTHFLCLPILTSTSLPQLAQSLTHFRAVADEFTRPAVVLPGDVGRQGAASPGSREALIPEEAFRPLGTLHLTVGVMSLDLGDGGMGRAGRVEEGREGKEVGGNRPEKGAWKRMGKAQQGSLLRKTVDDAVALLTGLDLASLLAKSKDDVSMAALGQGASSTPGGKGSELHEQSGDIGGTSLDTDKRKNVASDDGPTERPGELPAPSTFQRDISPPPTSALRRVTNTPSDGIAQSSRVPQPPLKISLRSLSAFPSSSKATVLHAIPHDPTRRLLCFAKALQQAFLAGNLMTAENRDLTLHVTVVNTKSAGKDKTRPGGNGRGGKKRWTDKVTVDARELIEVFSKKGGSLVDGTVDPKGEGQQNALESSQTKFVWAEDVVIDRVRICRMGARHIEGDAELGQEYEVVYEKMILSV